MSFRNLLAVVALCGTAATVANSQSVRVNWQKNAPFSDYKTYAWQFSPNENNSFYKQWVVQFVDGSLQKAGLQQVASSQNPALIVTYHFMTQELMDATTTTDGFGWGGGPWGYWGGWGGWGLGDTGSEISNTQERPRTMGILTVDLVEANAKRLVWRGQATEDSVSSSQKGDEKQVRKSIDKMFARFPPKKNG